MTERWHQRNIVFTDRDSARHLHRRVIAPLMATAEDQGALRLWWFMNKQPWPLRYTAATAHASLDDLLDTLTAEKRIRGWSNAIYEPETVAFGGELAMAAAHVQFHADSRHLLAYDPDAPGHLGRAETMVLLSSAMMRAARLDLFEQADVWHMVTALRPLPARSPRPHLAAAVHTLMTTDAKALTRPGRPLAAHPEWVDAFEHVGRSLADLARTGRLGRGLRAVLAHLVIFHANRAGIPAEHQHAISTLAEENVMGQPPATVSPAEHDDTGTNVPPVTENNDPETTAGALRDRLVDQLTADGTIHSPAVENALRTVPRHQFVPDASMEDAYGDRTVSIKAGPDGASISCASQPTVVALMLEQLQPQPGERILELGAGTGYNAALLGRLTGPGGHVITVDVDDDLVDGARDNLKAAGADNVTVLCRDGALGAAEHAPFDRIIATVGAHGVPHAWLAQLAPDGRLLVPQRLRGSVSRSIAYEHHDDGVWRSVSSAMNTFMPLRRGVADDDRPTIPITKDGSVRLQINSHDPVDTEALADVLAQPRAVTWCEVYYRARESPEWMELWLACNITGGLSQMPFTPQARGSVLTDDPYPSSTAATAGAALTYLARRPSTKVGPNGEKLWEFGVVSHGPGSTELSLEVAEAMRTWDRDWRDREAVFELHDLTTAPPTPQPGRFAFDNSLNRVVITW